ncbi:MAG: hypothetical protein ABF649_21925, partial [Bacillus sp. (in: firmicutes)]
CILNMRETKLDVVEINLPDEIISYFFISKDFVSIFNVETNDDALKLIKRILRDSLEEKLYKRISFDCEGDEVIISVNKADLMLKVALMINQLAKEEISETTKKEAEMLLTTYKRPKKQKWQKGSVFTVPMKNNSLVLAQVLVKFSAYSVLCALYEKPYMDITNVKEELEFSKPKFILTISTINLDDYTYKVIGKFLIFCGISDVEISEELQYSTFYSPILIELAEATNGISSFRDSHQEVLELQKTL